MIAIVEARDYADMSRRAADIVVGQVKDKPNSLLVLPTGNSPVGLFRELVERQNKGEVDFRDARFVTLDEYAGIGRDDPRRLFSWLMRELFDALSIAADRIDVFDPNAEPEAEAGRIERAIADSGGIDLAVLGLGPNGHLGFNEPGSAIDSRTRLVALAPESIVSNAAYWGSEAAVPRQAFTLGLGTLHEARQCLLIVSGTAKAQILARALEGPIGPAVPASLLRYHADAAVIADRAALGKS
jgi:glucosamine-6-phosphate deaminase